MERRFILFVVLSVAILFGHMALKQRLNPPVPPAPADEPPAAEAGAEADADADAEKTPTPPGKQDGADAETPEPTTTSPAGEGSPEPTETPAETPTETPPATPELPAELQEPAAARAWGSLGSADPDDPYRMLVTWDNRGAALARIEMSSPRYGDLDDRSGHLGHLVIDPGVADQTVRGKGCPVQVVGPGTPAAKAGLKPGDLIQAIGDQKITSADDLAAALDQSKPKRQITLTVLRDDAPIKLEVTLGRRPLEVVRPEAADPLSFLLTLDRVEGDGIDAPLAAERDDETLQVGAEPAGLNLWSGNWEVRESDQTHVVFARVLPTWGLEVTKSYRLEKVPAESIDEPDYKAYHLVFDVRIRNLSPQQRDVAYQLDGPTGLPAEGYWYANKISRTWGAVGLRDVVVSFDGEAPKLIGCAEIADDEVGPPWRGQTVSYIGVDAQYFSCVLAPQPDDRGVLLPPTKDGGELWFAESQSLRVGAVDEDWKNRTNASCRLISQLYSLAPGGQADDTLAHRFVIFAGPKKPDLLVQYNGLDELVYYGWFWWLAKPMAWILHFFYSIVGNYGLAILMLTVLVRGCMFPLGRKQAMGAQKMQELQPEIRRIQERYKNDMEARTKAQQELFRKHNYNPLSGCLVLFFQFPIFIALYRSLMVDIELRQAPLLSQGIRWCSNLAAPDMLFDWSGFMPEFITQGRGFLGLGPYFNVLPLVTVVLFILQQKLFMPPATDEKTAQQQKIMQFMMIFIGLMFFKVASGLCLYFIASSLWGVAERKLLPKTSLTPTDDKPPTRADAKSRDRTRDNTPPAKSSPLRALFGGNGGPPADSGKKKSNRGKP